jgi:hypothetical protein
MFDQYGTVVDIQTGLSEVAVDFLKTKGWHGTAYEFTTWWRRTHFENSMIDALLHRERTSNREIGHLLVRHVVNRARIEHTEDEVRWLVSCIERLKSFPEVWAALTRLQTTEKRTGRVCLVSFCCGPRRLIGGFERCAGEHSEGAFRPPAPRAEVRRGIRAWRIERRDAWLWPRLSGG